MSFSKGFIVLLLLFCTVAGQFLKERLVLVDKKNNNFLFRGNLPVKNNKFQIEELKQALSETTGLKKYKLVVYSLLNTLTAKQTKNKYIEENFFDKHPQYEYQSNLVLGSVFDPKSFPIFLREFFVSIYEYISFDQMFNLLDQFQQRLNSKTPTIVFFHCSAGVDRTGFVSAAYNMRFYKMSFKNAYEKNMNVLNGVRKYMHFNTYHGMQWFCLQLGRKQQQCLQKLQD